MTKPEASIIEDVGDAEGLAEIGPIEDKTEEREHDANLQRKHVLPQWVPRFGCKVGAILLASTFIAVAGLAGWVYWYRYRPDQQADNAAAKAAIGAASDGTVAVLSYAPDSADHDFAAAKSHLTGDFLAYYSKFTEQVVAPAVKDKGVKKTATVAQAALSELHTDSAEVLLFVNQTMTSKASQEPDQTSSSVVVQLTKINGHWLISKFDPV
jgi:Mce-associated membrane protein